MKNNPIRDIPHYLDVLHDYLGREIYGVFALMLFAGILESFGIILLVPLIEGLQATNDGQSNEINLFISGFFDALGLSAAPLHILLLIVLIFVFKGLITFGALALIARLKSRLLLTLKTRLFRAYSRMSYQHYSSKGAGHFVNVINSQSSQMIQASHAMMKLGSHLVMASAYVVLAILVSWQFGLLALASGIALLSLFHGVGDYVRKHSRLIAAESGHLAQSLIQFLNGFKYLRATGQTDSVGRFIEHSARQLASFEWRTGLAHGFAQALREPAAVILIVVILSVQLFVWKQPLGPTIVAMVLFYRALNVLLSLQTEWQRVLQHAGGLEFVRDELLEQDKHSEPDSNRILAPLTQSVVFRDISFSYRPNEAKVLSGLSLEIPAKNSVAIVAGSGAGKTTILDLLTLVIQPTSGKLLIDGEDSTHLNAYSWRNQVGYVSQEMVIFNDSLLNNISMWNYSAEPGGILLKKVREAARKAHIDDFIVGLPEGYHTKAGDRGMKLSGGQRQRLFIARELFREPRLLILDEATSSLDEESERYIQESIDELKGELTVVIVAHRLSTIRNVDKVYVLDAGKVVNSGTYGEICNP